MKEEKKIFYWWDLRKCFIFKIEKEFYENYSEGKWEIIYDWWNWKNILIKGVENKI